MLSGTELSGESEFIHQKSVRWDQVYQEKHTDKIFKDIHEKSEKYQINLFIPIKFYNDYIDAIEKILKRAIDEEIIFWYKKIGGTKIYNTETMQESVNRAHKRADHPTAIANKLIDFNNPVLFYPVSDNSDAAISALANLCDELESVLKNIQEENNFLNPADLRLTNHLYFRKISLYNYYIDIFELTQEQLQLLKQTASRSYLFSQLEEKLYHHRDIQKYINQLQNFASQYHPQDQITLKNLRTKLDLLEVDNMGLSAEDLKEMTEREIKKLLKDLRTAAMEQLVLNTYQAMREGSFLGRSSAADALENILNAPDKMGLLNKYGDYLRVPDDPGSNQMPLICKRYVNTGKVSFNLKAMQNQNFMVEAINIIVSKIKDKSEFEKTIESKINSGMDTDQSIVACFNYYFSDPSSSSDPKINWLKIYSFHPDDFLMDRTIQDKFRMQIILTDLIEQQVIGIQNAGLLLNSNEITENKKNLPFTYAYQQFKIWKSRMRTNRAELNTLDAELLEYNNLTDVNEGVKFNLLKAKIYQVRMEVKNKAEGETRFFKCFAKSNLVNGLIAYEDKVIAEVDSLIQDARALKNERKHFKP